MFRIKGLRGLEFRIRFRVQGLFILLFLFFLGGGVRREVLIGFWCFRMLGAFRCLGFGCYRVFFLGGGGKRMEARSFP